MRRVFRAVGRKWMMWAAAAILVACGGWFVAHILPWREPASAKQEQVTPEQLVPKQPAVEAKPPSVAERIVDGPAKKAPAPKAAPEPRRANTPAVPGTAVIETLAGRPWRFIGDGMPALQAPLGHCDDMKCDREGNIYASDWGNQMIVKIDRSGVLHVLAGPDSAQSSRPFNPIGLVLDGSGAVYFSQGISIRKLLPGGQVVPFAGSKQPGFTPDGSLAEGSALTEVSGMVMAADRSLVFSEHGSQRVRRVDLQGRLRTVAGDGKRRFAGDKGPAPQASLAGPRGLALDSAGNLFIADQDNHCVRRVSPDGRITTVAGQGVAGELGCPSGLAVNSRGDLYVADPCKRQVFMVRDGGMWRVGGTGAGSPGAFRGRRTCYRGVV
jgi:streptogramin lyase